MIGVPNMHPTGRAGRPPIPIDPGSGPTAAFKHALVQVRECASLTLRELSEKVPASRASLSNAQNPHRRLPTWEITEEWLKGCGITSDGDLQVWHTRWDKARIQAGLVAPGPDAATQHTAGRSNGDSTPTADDLQPGDPLTPSLPGPALIDRLRQLRTLAGEPTYWQLERTSASIRDHHQGRRLYPLTASTLSRILTGRTVRPPRWEKVAMFVLACQTHAQQIQLPLPKTATNLESWRAWHAAELRRSTPPDARPATPWRKPITEWLPFELGIHRPISSDGDSYAGHPGHRERGPLPAYVRRTHDDLLQDLISRTSGHALIALVGGAASGKTRAAYEAVHELLHDWLVVRPDDCAHLCDLVDDRKIPARAVLWLDDAQGFLAGVDAAASAQALRRLLSSSAGQIIVITTMWPDLWSTLTAGPDPHGADPGTTVRDLLLSEVTTQILISETFTPAESLQLREAARSDSRLRAAITRAALDDNVLAALQADIGLVHAYLDRPADPYQAALTTAAIDARRLGMHSPLPRDLLLHAARGYLPADPPRVTDEEEIKLIRALTEITGLRQPLEPAGQWPAFPATEHFHLNDYLARRGAAVRRTEPVPGALWIALINHATDDQDRWRLAREAHRRHLNQHAVLLLKPVAACGDTRAMRLLAQIAQQADQIDAAEWWWRRIIDTGETKAMIELADVLRTADLLSRAEEVLRHAATIGESGAMRPLQALLRQAGRAEEANQLRRWGLTPDGATAGPPPHLTGE